MDLKAIDQELELMDGVLRIVGIPSADIGDLELTLARRIVRAAIRENTVARAYAADLLGCSGHAAPVARAEGPEVA